MQHDWPFFGPSRHWPFSAALEQVWDEDEPDDELDELGGGVWPEDPDELPEDPEEPDEPELLPPPPLLLLPLHAARTRERTKA